MKKIPYYIVDAFTSQPFSGNPAAVCLLDAFLDDQVLASIAAEFNLSETAFIKANEDRWDLRWFTPTTEVRLCGHATLAAAAVLFSPLGHGMNHLEFVSCSGPIPVTRQDNGRLELDFPSRDAKEIADFPLELGALGVLPQKVLRAEEDLLCIYETADDIRRIVPDFQRLSKVEVRGVIISAPGEGDIDFVSRFFAPRVGVDEDPVTGSAHATLTPYWARRLDRRCLQAEQLSKRGGRLHVSMGTSDERVLIAGDTVIIAEGSLQL